MSQDVTPREVESADDIRVKKPGANMLWIEVDWGNGDTESFSVKATPENSMLFNRNKYTFNGNSLYSLLFGDAHTRVVISEDNPYLAVKPGPYNDTYRLWVDSPIKPILTYSDQSKDVLRGIVQFAEQENPSPLVELYENVSESQINRDSIMTLYDEGHLEGDRIEPTADGFVVDDLFLITWEAKLYIYTDTWKDGAFTPQGNSKDKPGQFQKITVNIDDDIEFESESGVRYTLGELEQKFIYRLDWICDWEENLDAANVESVKRTVPMIQKHDI